MVTKKRSKRPWRKAWHCIDPDGYVSAHETREAAVKRSKTYREEGEVVGPYVLAERVRNK